VFKILNEEMKDRKRKKQERKMMGCFEEIELKIEAEDWNKEKEKSVLTIW
jgi:hypothetical protein